MTNGLKKYIPFNTNGNLSKFASVFGLSEREVKSWKDKEKTLEKLLNLSPSEDSTIVNFIIPLLKNGLGYTTKEIDIKPSLHINYKRKVVERGGQSDVVVRKGKRPVFVIEAKAYGHPLKTKDEDAEGQAWDYTRANELKPPPWYYIATNVVEICIYETDTRKEILKITEDELDKRLHQIISLLSKDKISAPTPEKRAEIQTVFKRAVTNKKEFERILFKCQDFMREAKEAKTGKAAFDEMNKLLFIKIFEDRREMKGEENRFTTYKILTEGQNYIKGTLFPDVREFYKKSGKPIFLDKEDIELDLFTINKIVEKLQSYYLVDEEGRVHEPVGDVYENFVSTIFRGENGQYFTPRPIVIFITNMVGIKWGQNGMKICDPACGSGGFLLEAFSALHEDLKKEFCKKAPNGELVFKSEVAEKEYNKCKQELCKNLLVGYDNEPSVAKTAMMNMSVHGDGSVGVFADNSLVKLDTQDILEKNSFDAIMTNPPFSLVVEKNSIKDESDTDILEGYTLAHSHKFNKDKNEFEELKGSNHILNQDAKILFLERCHYLVKSKGLVGIVIDDGVLNNKTNAYVRDWLFRHFVIKAVVSLPFGAFKERGADNYTSILILQKKGEHDIQGDIFMAKAKHVGELFGKLGHREKNDLIEIHKDWEAFKKGKTSLKHSFTIKKDNIENYFDENQKTYRNRIDPKYYDPKIKKLIQVIEKSSDAKPIYEVVDFEDERCSSEDVNTFGSKYIKRITKQGVVEFEVIDGINTPKTRMDRVFRKGELVASRINIKSGMIAFIPDDVDEIRASNEYYKLISKIDKKGKPLILTKYLYIILTSPSIQSLMDSMATGQYGRLKESELGNIKIPVPDTSKQEKLIELYEKEKAEIKELKADAERKIRELQKRIESTFIKSG